MFRSQHTSNDAASDYSTDLIRLLASGTLAALSLFGTTYFHEYYSTFGISMFEVDVGFLEATVIGFRLMLDGWAVAKLAGAVILFSIVVAIAQQKLSNLIFYIASFAMLFAICCIVVLVAVQEARSDSARVTRGETGRVAYCDLRDEAQFSREFAEEFSEWNRRGAVRKILETSTTVYLSVTVDTKMEGFNGQTFGINKSDILYCRVIGN